MQPALVFQQGFEQAAASHDSKELSRRPEDDHCVAVEVLKPRHDVGERGRAFESEGISTGDEIREDSERVTSDPFALYLAQEEWGWSGDRDYRFLQV